MRPGSGSALLSIGLEILTRGGIVRLDFQDVGEHLVCLHMIPALAQGDTQVEHGVHEARIDVQSVLELAYGLGDQSLRAVRDAQMVANIGVVRVQREGFLVLGSRFRKQPPLVIVVAKPVVEENSSTSVCDTCSNACRAARCSPA